jgi:hypothetical protein
VPGDSIRVVEGELKSLQVTVVQVDELQGIVRVRLRDEDWAQLGQAAKAVSLQTFFTDGLNLGTLISEKGFASGFALRKRDGGCCWMSSPFRISKAGTLDVSDSQR